MNITDLMDILDLEYAGPRTASHSQLLVRDYASRHAVKKDTVTKAMPKSFRSHKGKDTIIWEDGKNVLIEYSEATGIATVTFCNSSVFAPYRTWRLGKLKRGGVDATQIHKKRRHFR